MLVFCTAFSKLSKQVLQFIDYNIVIGFDTDCTTNTKLTKYNR